VDVGYVGIEELMVVLLILLFVSQTRGVPAKESLMLK